MNYGIYRFYLSFEGTREGRVGSGNKNRPNDTLLGHRYVFFFKKISILSLMVYIVFVYRFYLLFQGTKKAVTTKTGPNDVLRHVAWAISTHFFIRVHAY